MDIHPRKEYCKKRPKLLSFIPFKSAELILQEIGWGVEKIK